MTIFFFLSPSTSQSPKTPKIRTLIEARSTPEAGLSASWNGRYRAIRLSQKDIKQLLNIFFNITQPRAINKPPLENFSSTLVYGKD
jgi:hypothetical protein